MHDDIIDRSDSRRGLRAHHLVFGERSTLFAGDYIVARAAKVVHSFGDVAMFQIYATIIQDLTVGEVFQAERVSPGPEDLFLRYLSKSYFKTGSLISNALRGVAQLLGLPQ
jgi:geranyl diphosphate synthase